MTIDKIIEALKESLPRTGVYMSGFPITIYIEKELENLKELLITSRDVIKYGREETIKEKLIFDISEYLKE